MIAYPENWAAVNLFEICRPKQWKVISAKELQPSGHTVYGANGQIGFYSAFTHEYPTLMITCRGATCGNLHVSVPFSYINGNAMALDSLDESICEIGFLRRYLQSRGFSDVISGSAQPQITQDGLKKVKVPIPPKAEQKRIANKLEILLSRVDACRERLELVPTLIKRFKQSVLDSAISGGLTQDFKTLNNLPSWKTVDLGEICLKVTDGEHLTPRRSSAGKYLLSARNIQNGYLALENVDFVDQAEFAKLRLRCAPALGDVLLSCSGSVGRVALVDKDDEYVMVRSAAMIRPDPKKLRPDFLMYALQSPEMQQKILDASRSTAQSNIFLGPIKKLRVPVPSIGEQEQIVKQIENLFHIVRRVEKRWKTASTEIERLTPALLAKAFRGELVPQDPNDEPAQKLLERLKAIKSAVPTKASPRDRKRTLKT